MEAKDFEKLIDQIFAKNNIQEQFFNNSDMLFSVVGKDGKLTLVNDAWAKCLGMTKKQIQSIPFSILIHPDDLALTSDIYSFYVDTNKTATYMYSNRYRKLDGSYAHILWFDSIHMKEKGYSLASAIEIPEDQPPYLAIQNGYIPFKWKK